MFCYQLFNENLYALGQVIYQTKDVMKGWNGKCGDLAAAVYVWMIEYSNPNSKEKFLKKGTVALIR